MIPYQNNYNNVVLALTCCFCVIFAEDWNWDMYYNIVGFGTKRYAYLPYWVVLFFFGNYILFFLFTAILLSYFDSDEAEEEETEDTL